MRSLRRSSLWLALTFGVPLGVLLGTAWVASDTREAQAVGTRTFELDTLDKLSGGELKGTAITSSGEVEAGWSTARTSLARANIVFAGLSRADGSVLLGTAPEGRVLKIDAAGKESVVAETGALAVTSLVEGPGGKIYAATLPEGEIFIVDPAASVGTNPSAPAAPKPKAWAKVGSDHIWALVYDKKRNELFAATGPDGKVYRVDAAGKAQVFFTAEDTQVVSLAISPSGTLYAGTSGKGLLLAINAAGRAEVVQDFAGHEVKAIGFGPTVGAAPKTAPTKGGKGGKAAPAPTPESASKVDGETLFCIVNEYATPPEPPRKSGISTKMPGAGFEPPKSLRAKGELWKISALAADGTGGRPERLLRDDATHFFSMSVDPTPKAGGAVAYVGTGNDGRVIAVDDLHATKVVAKAESRQIGAISAAGGVKGAWFATGDAGGFYRVTGIGSADAMWTSKILDAGHKARFGKLTWRTSIPNGIELQTRSGNTAVADDSWSAWSAALGSPGKVTSPAGRYVQIRGRWKSSPDAVLRGVSLAFVTENLRAIVTEVSVSGKTGSGYYGPVYSGADAPSKSSSVRISWRVDNPDGDTLRHRLWYRREESPTWRAITRDEDPVSGSEYTWHTESLAEGHYLVRVEASDELANPLGFATKHATESLPFVVDNTPPQITKMALVGGRLQASITDGIGPIVRLDVMIDGKGGWRSITSKDGILDDATEEVDTVLSSTGTLVGSHVVALRAYDAAGNAVTREIEGK